MEEISVKDVFVVTSGSGRTEILGVYVNHETAYQKMDDALKWHFILIYSEHYRNYEEFLDDVEVYEHENNHSKQYKISGGGKINVVPSGLYYQAIEKEGV